MGIRVLQNNFSGGEFSPAMYSRVDLDKYSTGAELIENGIVHPHGGVSKRGGLRFVAKLPGEGYLIPFTYRVEQAYVLCFTEKHLYIFAGGEQVADLASDYTLAEAREMSAVQSADVLFIAHPNHPPTRLERYLDESEVKWRFVEMQFEPSIARPGALTLTKAGFSSGSQKLLRYQVSAVSAAEEESYPSETSSTNIPKQWTAGATITISWDPVDGAVRYNVYKNERGFYGWIGTVEASEGLSFVDDNISPASGDGPKTPGITFRMLDTPTIVSLEPQGSGPFTKRLQVRVALASDERDESVASEVQTCLVDVHEAELATLTVNAPDPGISGAGFVIYYRYDTDAVWARATPREWHAGDQVFGIYDNGGFWPTGIPRDEARVYPGVVGIYQQRLVFARSNEEPQTIWCSQTGALNNFSTSYPLKDTDAIEVAMDSRQMNEIRHLYLLKNQLVVLTAGSEWMMGPGRNSDGITPTNVHFTNQSFYGTSKVPPLQAGDALLMVLNSGRAVRDLYATYTDEYEGNEVSIMAEHLFAKPITDWAWQEEPYHTAYAVRDDGVMLCFTYMREQKLSAWSHFVTDGGFKSVSCIREGGEDRVYCVVERGGDYNIEYFVNRRYGDDVVDAFYVDGGVAKTADTPATVFAGIPEHLWGKDVVVLADGGEVRVTVEEYEYEDPPYSGNYVHDGRITLPHPVSKVVVGLPYDFTLRTLDPELNGQRGSTMGLRKNAVNCVLRVRETRGVMVGPDEAHLLPAKFPLQEDWEGEGSALPLFTGDIQLALLGQHRREAAVTIRQSTPFPATILSLNLTVNSES